MRSAGTLKYFSDAVLLRDFFVYLADVSGCITEATLDLYMPGPPNRGYEFDQPSEPLPGH